MASETNAAAGGAGSSVSILTLDNATPITQLLEKRKQMVTIQNSLDSQKTEYVRKEEMFRRREENLRKKDLELQEALVLFNKFLKENEHKRRRAEHKTADEIKKRLKWEQELQAKIQQVAELQRKLHEKRVLFQKYQPYQQFFGTIMEQHATQFDDGLESILRRFSTLEGARADLRTQQQQYTKDADVIRADLSSFRKQMFHDSLVLNNTIARLSKELEAAVTATTGAEESLRTKEAGALEQMRRVSLLVMGIDNIFTRCTKAALVAGVKLQIQHSIKKSEDTDKPEGMAARVQVQDKTEVKDDVETYTRNQLDVIDAYLEDFAALERTLSRDKRAAGPEVAGRKAKELPPNARGRATEAPWTQKGREREAGQSGSGLHADFDDN